MHQRTVGRGLIRDTRGANLVEYILVVGFIAMVALVGLRAFGERVTAKVEAQAQRIETLEGAPAEKKGGGGGLFGAVGDFFGGVADVGKSFLGTAWNVGKGLFDFQLNFDIGVAKGAWGVVTGIGNAIIHPVDTAKGLWYAYNHPFATAWAIGAGYVNDIRDDPAQGSGKLAFTVVTTVATGGVAEAAGGTTGKVIEAVDKAHTVASVSEKGNEAREGTPGPVAWADKWVAPFLPGHVKLPFIG